MEDYGFGAYDETSFPPPQEQQDQADEFVVIDDNAITTTTTNNKSSMTGSQTFAMKEDAKSNVAPTTNASNGAIEQNPDEQRAKVELRQAMEGVVRGAAVQLNDTLGETKVITQKCLEAITNYVNGLESVHNEWRSMLWKQEQERNHLEQLLPQVKGATNQFHMTTPSDMNPM